MTIETGIQSYYVLSNFLFQKIPSPTLEKSEWKGTWSRVDVISSEIITRDPRDTCNPRHHVQTITRPHLYQISQTKLIFLLMTNKLQFIDKMNIIFDFTLETSHVPKLCLDWVIEERLSLLHWMKCEFIWIVSTLTQFSSCHLMKLSLRNSIVQKPQPSLILSRNKIQANFSHHFLVVNFGKVGLMITDVFISRLQASIELITI